MGGGELRQTIFKEIFVFSEKLWTGSNLLRVKKYPVFKNLNI